MKLTVKRAVKPNKIINDTSPFEKISTRKMYQAVLFLNVFYFKWASGKSDSFYFYKTQSMCPPR